MGLFYEYKPPPPDEQHKRLVALRQLTSRGIPCILWGEDALNYVHSVPTSLFDQQILVPDEFLESASSILQEGPYFPVPFTEDYTDFWGPNVGKSAYPQGILLKHPDIPDEDPYKLDPLPGYIILLPQSYFGLDVRSKERFQSLVPPLPPSNADILAPKFNTLLEGLVAFNLNPPIPLETPHARGRAKHDIFIGYLLRYRVKYEDDGDTPPPKELVPEERVILDELQTEDARWYIGVYVGERRLLQHEELSEYNRQKALGLRPKAKIPGPALSSTSSLNDTRRSYSTTCCPNSLLLHKDTTIANRPFLPTCIRKPISQTSLRKKIVSASQLLARRRFL